MKNGKRKIHPLAVIGLIMLLSFLYFLWTEKKGNDVDQGKLAYDIMYNGVSNYEERINIPVLTADGDSEKIYVPFRQVRADHPELFWLTGEATLNHVTIGGVTVYTLTVESRCDVSEIPQMEANLERVVSQIVDMANAKCETDYEKALFVHDTLILNCEYDMDTYYQNLSDAYDGSSLGYSAYGCLVNHKAVCEGYTRAYMLIMNRLGIECGYVRGTATNSVGTTGLHSWNYIKLDDGYYMVDVTWDDPYGNEDNVYYRDYFCLTTEMISENHQIENSQDVPLCNGRKYIK